MFGNKKYLLVMLVPLLLFLLHLVPAEAAEVDVKRAASLRELALTYEETGRFKEALSLREKVAQIYTEKLGETHLETLQCFNELAIAYFEHGDWAEALILQEKIVKLRIEVQGEKHPDTASSMVNLANCYGFLGRNSDALVLYEKALKLLRGSRGEKSIDTISCMNSLAVIYGILERYEESRVLGEKVLLLSKEVLGEKDPNTIGSMANLASTYRDLNNNEQARILYEQVLVLSTQVLGEKHPDTISSMANLANSYSDMGQVEDSLALEKQALHLSREVLGPTHPNTIDSLIKVAYCYIRLGRNGEAIELAKEAVDGIELLRSQGELSNGNRQMLFAKFSQVYKELGELYRIQNQPYEAFRLGELTKARTLLEASAARLADQSGILETEEVDKIREYERRLSQFDAAITKALSEPEEKISLESEKNQLVSEVQAYRQRLMNKYPKYAQLNNVKIIGVEDGMEIIPGHSAFVSYLIRSGSQKGDSVVTAFTLSKERGLKVTSLGTIPHLEETLAAYSKALQGRKVWRMEDGSYQNSLGYFRPEGSVAFAGGNEISAYLGEKLLKPLQEEIKGKGHWIISGDGALPFIPFETMMLDGQAVIDKYDIGYIQSLSMLKLIQDRKQEYSLLENRSELFAMGAAEYPGESLGERGIDEKDNQLPDIDATAAMRGGYTQKAVEDVYGKLLKYPWENLPTSAEELNNLATIFGDKALIYRKEDASEAKLQQCNGEKELEKYRYMVFSTHAYFCSQEPGLSSVVLNQVHKTKDTDGYITAVKWPAYNLKSDLMFFSACETGLGRLIQGEGVTGLPFALYVAGNTNTVFTLWEVIDESSTKFTDLFFRKIQAGKEHTAALNETKREMKADLRYANPRYWAPYVLYGI